MTAPGIYSFLMKSSGYTSKADKFRAWLEKSVVDDSPPKLDACEICGVLEVNNEKWLACEKRIQARDDIIESGNKNTAQATPCCELSATKEVAML